MGFIVQMQRRVIEAIYADHELTIEEGAKYFIGDDEVFLLGISRGIGTCSDLHGIDIAVFGKSRLDPEHESRQRKYDASITSCRGAVLLRDPDSVDKNMPHLMLLEALLTIKQGGATTHFEKTGKASTYV